MDEHVRIEDAEQRTVTGQIDGVLDYTIELRPTPDRGLEVIVSLVNECECDMRVSAVKVRHALDGRDGGEHEVYFRDADRHGVVDLPQFVVAEGHYHVLEDVHRAQRFEATLAVDYEILGDRSHAEVVRKVTTKVFRRGS